MNLIRFIAAVVAGLLSARSWASDSLLPRFSGLMNSQATGTIFSLQWQSPRGGSVQAWLRVGDRAGDFKLVGFNPNGEVLTLEDPLGRHYDLVLPEGKVRAEELTEAEYQELFRWLNPGADVARAPVLSRERARAFYLEKIRRMFSKWQDVEVLFDLDGSTLPPDVRATWAERVVKTRAAGGVLRAVVIGGKTEIHEFPLRPFPMPEQMTRNLWDSDWDEIALLVGTNALKRRLLRR